MKARHPIIALLIYVASASAADATASKYMIDYKGSLIDGFDGGTFGNSGGDLKGLPYEADFLFNLNQPGATIDSHTGFFSSYGTGAASPLSATFHLGGKTIGFSGGDGWQIQSTSEYLDPYVPIYSEYSSIIEIPGQFITNGNYITDGYQSLTTPFITSPLFGGGFTYNVPPDDVATQGTAQNDNQGRFLLPDNSFGDLNIASFTVSPVSALPEPATWVLMVLGFGSIGYALRSPTLIETRRRRAPALAPA